MVFEIVGNGCIGLPIIAVKEHIFQIDLHYRAMLHEIYSEYNNPALHKTLSDHFSKNPNFEDLLGKNVLDSGMSGQFDPDSFFKWVLYHANTVGFEQALMDADEYLQTDYIRTSEVQMIIGPNLGSTVQLDEEISIGPLSNLDQSVLSQEYEAAKQLTQIDINIPTVCIVQKGSHLKIVPDNWPHSGRDAPSQRPIYFTWLINALDDCFGFPSTKTAFADKQFPFHTFFGSGSSRPLYDFVPHDVCQLDPLVLQQQLIQLERNFSQATSEFRDRMILALRRLGAAKAKLDPAERALDLGIALEMMLLSNENAQQLSLTFRSRGAWLLGKSSEDRQRVFSLLQDIYNARSQVAHNGTFSNKNRLSVEHLNIASSIARALVIRRSFPTAKQWVSMTLGQ